MALGYDQKLYILAFDHRGSYRKMFGFSAESEAEQQERLIEGKRLIFDGMVIAAEAGEDPSLMGVLVDEEYGTDVAREAHKHGLKLSMPVEKTGQDIFDFDFGDQFGEHIEAFDPDFAKVLVRYNPDAEATEANVLQLQRLKRLSDWLHERDRRFLFELLVPATQQQLDSVGGDVSRYDDELRPELMRRAIEEFQNAGIEADIWKIEGLNSREDCARLAEQTRAGGRDGVKCVLLGRGADDAQVDAWLRAAAPVPGFIGFAIGRSTWSPVLKAYLAGDMRREDAAAKIAENYTRFIQVYREAEAGG
jgi:myo-inositol catabolism protein IolC